jgi:hypothetical protein
MPRSKVTRYVSKENLKWLPDHATVQFGYRKKHQQGLVKVELDFYWIRNNGKKYEELMGEL